MQQGAITAQERQCMTCQVRVGKIGKR